VQITRSLGLLCGLLGLLRVAYLICLLQVICLDNFFTGTKENVAHLLHKDNFELMRHDVVNPILLEVDEIYHLACPASPIHYKCVSALVCAPCAMQ
jgi:hypothetical protein